MKNIIKFIILALLCHFPNLYAQLQFKGNHIIYKDKTIQLGPKAFYIDGQLSKAEASKYKYVYTSINDAVKDLSDGDETNPMVLYIAPWVYWIDNPDDPEIRQPKPGSKVPIGLEIKCEWLRFQGLSEDPKNVILASNRGQTIGANGNFTMLDIKGEGTAAENLTFGNFCNIDLIYPPNPKLNRAKRASAIVQGQLIFADGDKVFARNVRFVSRLNLAPFWGSKRTLFENCHFESTDDALNPTAVYLNCNFDFYSSKPFYRTSGTGAVFLNCDITSYTRDQQYFVKESGPISIIDSRINGKNLTYLGWKDLPREESRSYELNTTLNGIEYHISNQTPDVTVAMENKEIRYAYRLEYNNQIIYNTYNLLRGNDNWDPMGIKDLIEKAEKETSKNYSNIPTLLTINPTRKTLETAKDTLELRSMVYRFGSYEAKGEKVNWKIAPKYNSFVELKPDNTGKCLVIPTNLSDQNQEVIITASTESGLDASTVLTITAAVLPAPHFKELPKISKTKDAKLHLDYVLDMPYEDQSLISWFRCSDAQGSHPIEIAVSRGNKPLKTYSLSSSDIGYFIMASISPKHQRCEPGVAKKVVFNSRISKSMIGQSDNTLRPNLEQMSGKYQPEVLEGYWTLDSYSPVDTANQDWSADNSKDPWYYGTLENKPSNSTGFIQATKGARMRYTPRGKSFGDMKLSFTAIPAKTAGQGFSSARAQYMDIGIKMDNKQMNGYALRIVRTTKYSDAVDFILMKYENAKASPISEAVSTSCFRPNCKITVEVKENILRVTAENPLDYFSENYPKEVLKKVELQAPISPNPYGGISIQHTGTIGSGATLINDLFIEWN